MSLNTNVAASPPFDFCTITGRFDTAPQYHRSTFEGLADYLASHVRMVTITREKYLGLPKDEQASIKDGPAIILACFKHGTKRTDDNVEYTTGIGLDIDEAHIELPVLKAVFAGTLAILYESANSTPEFRRWRVLIPYVRAATPAEHGRVFDYWCGKVHGIGAQSRNVSRLWYGVTKFAKAPARIFDVLEGVAFDPASIPALNAIEASKAAFRSIPLPANTLATEGARNATLSRYALSIIDGCETYEGFLMALMLQNNKYAPPLEPKEVEAMARAKWKKFGKVTVPAHVHPDVGTTHSEDDAPVGEEIGEYFTYDPGPVPWLIQDVMTHGAHLLVGRPKGGKSWITMDMAFAVGNGSAFIGYPAVKAKVLWIAGEDSKDTLSRRLRFRGEQATGITILNMDTLKEERERNGPEVTFEAWLRGYLDAHPDTGLVIIDTHKTVEAIWNYEQIDNRRHASAVDIAYQMVRLFDDIGQKTRTSIVLVHHAGKAKHNKGADYHERINMPLTAVAGATCSMVLLDPDDRDLNDEDDYRRIFAIRSRHATKEVPHLIELQAGRAKLVNASYFEHVQTQAQAEVFTVIEELLMHQPTCTMREVATSLGKHLNTVQQALKRAARKPGGLTWKGRDLVLQQGVGLRWAK